MADLAELGLRFTTEGGEQAVRILDQVEKKAKAADQATEGLSGAQRQAKRATDEFSGSASRAARATDQITGGANRAARATDMFKAAVIGLGAGLASIGLSRLAGELIRIGDQYSSLSARVRLVTSSTSEAGEAMDDLFDIAQRTRVGLSETVDLYTRLARSTESLGASQEQVKRVTETINQALIVSGTSAAQASGSLMQLGQAFASGALRGDELNSVLEGMPRVAKAIADGMGITVGQLRALGAEGALASEKIFEALLSQTDAIEAEFSQMPLTVAQAMEQMRNAVLVAVGEFDQATGLTQKLANSISYMTDLITGAERPVLALQIAVNALGLSAALVAARQLYALAASVAAATASAVTGSAAWIAYTAAVARVGFASATATAATTALGVAVRFALGPIGLMITAIGLVATGMALSSRATQDQESRVRAADGALDAYEQAATAAAIATGESAVKARENAEAMRQEALAAITAAKALREKELAALKAAEARQRDPFIAQRNTNPLGNPDADPLVVQTRQRLAKATEEAAKLEARYADILSGKTLPALPKVAAATEQLTATNTRAAAASREAAQAASEFERELARVLEQLMTPAEKALKELHANMAILREGFDRGKLSADQYREAMDRLFPVARELVKVTDVDLKQAAGSLNEVRFNNWRGEFERTVDMARDLRWSIDDIARSIQEKDWGAAFSGLFRTLEKARDLWNSGQPGGKYSAAGAVLSSAGSAVGGTAGSVISGIGSGFSAAGAAAGMAGMGAMGGAIAGLAGPIGIAVAGFSILSKVLSDGAAKKRAKAEQEARDMQNAAAIAQERANKRAELEIELLRAQGDELAAVTREREKELAALDSVSAAIQRQIYALTDWKKTVAEAESAVAKAEADLRQAYDREVARLEGIIGGVDAARRDLEQAYNRERSAIEATVNGVEGLIASLRDFRDELNLNPLAGASPGQGREAALGQFRSASAEDLPQAGRAFLDASMGSARTMAEFQRDRALVARAIDEVAAASQAQLTDAEKQLAALDKQVAGLIAANDNLLSVEQAIRNLVTAEQAAAEATAQLDALNAQVGALINLNAGFMSVAQAIDNLASAQQALAAAQAAKPSGAAGAGAAYEAVGFDGYVDRNADLASLYAAGTGMARGRSKAEFGQYHWERYGQAEDRFYRPFANGGAFAGGVVSAPTAFPMGMMGEAGPEAIMPLVNRGGRLGVEAANDGLKEEIAGLRQEMAALRSASERTARATEDAKDVLEGAARGQLSLTTEAAA